MGHLLDACLWSERVGAALRYGWRLPRMEAQLTLAVVDRDDVEGAQHVGAEQPLDAARRVPERKVRADDRRRRQLDVAGAPGPHLDERRLRDRADAGDLAGRPLPRHLELLRDPRVEERPRRTRIERERER